MNSKNASIIFLGIAMLCFGYLLAMHLVFSTNPVGIAIQLLAVSLMAWARFTFGIRSFHGAANTTKGGLITHGPYKWFRHPIYAALIYFIWAGILSHISIETIGAAIVITLCLVGRFLLEEKFLMETYPEYQTYAAKTKRIIPFLI